MIRTATADYCFQDWPNIITHYVAAQKMRDPQRTLAEIENQFCASVYGEQNAAAAKKLYQACEKFVHPERYLAFRPETDCLPDLFGTSQYNRELQEALLAAQGVTFPAHFRPRLTSPTPPSEMFSYLKNNATLISIFSEAAERILQLKTKGASLAELRRTEEAAIRRAESLRDDPDYKELKDRLHLMLPKSETEQSFQPKRTSHTESTGSQTRRQVE